MNVAELPPAMSTAEATSAVTAAAPPVVLAEGGEGAGRTWRAVASPRLSTLRRALNCWPRLTLAGSDSAVTESCAGSCTAVVPEDAEAAARDAPDFASVPDAAALNCRLPEEVPSSMKVQLNSALPP